MATSSDGYNSFAIGMVLVIVGILATIMGVLIRAGQASAEDGKLKPGSKVVIGGLVSVILGSILIAMGNKKG